AMPRPALEVTTPIDEDAVMLAWPLPTDPLLSTRARAVASGVVGAIDQAVAGYVGEIYVGDDRAPWLGVVVFPGEGETLDAVSTAAKEAVDDVPAAFRNTRRGFGELAFDNVQQ